MIDQRKQQRESDNAAELGGRVDNLGIIASYSCSKLAILKGYVKKPSWLTVVGKCLKQIS
jgi:hypothetical protein